MSKRTFRILYRDFLFRVVDRELLSPHSAGDSHKVFTQIAAVLVLFSIAISMPAFGSYESFSAPVRLFIAWRFVHFIIATTMLAVGMLAILSWGSMFPDQRDVLVLAPLPVHGRTILLAKVAAIVTALGFAVLATHAAAGLMWPLALNRSAPAIAMPSFTRDPAMTPVQVPDLPHVLDRDLANARTSGWLAPEAGGGLVIAVSQHGARRVLRYGAARPDSIFQVGSVTKTFTAFALARMVQDGRMRLDTPVRESLPAIGIPLAVSPQQEITFVDLATHHSGLRVMPAGIRPDRQRSPFAFYGTSDLYASLRRRGLGKPEDAGFLYSNLGFGLLGHALAVKAGTDYATLIRQVVAEPLRLADTTVNLSPEQSQRLIQGYDDEGQMVDAWTFDLLAGAGAMYATAPDLLRWLEINLRPTEPLAPAIELMQRPLRAARGGADIGLAWMIDRATSSLSHGGAVGGYTADVFFNSKDDLALVVLANRGPGVVAPASRVAEYVRARVYGTPAPSLDDLVIPAAAGGVRSWPRTLLAYWLTMIAASAFIAGSLIGVQGLAIALLSRRRFLRVSPILQFVAFALLVGGYLLQPIGFVADDLVAAQAGGLLAASPSYWFLGLYQSLNGSTAMPVLAARAWTSVVAAVALACLAYGVSYIRTLRGIAEESGVTAAAGVRRHVLAGHGPTRGLTDFALTTLARSAQPRVLMAFYWGFGFALTVAFAKTPRGHGLASASDAAPWHEGSVPFLVASILMLGASILAARSAFAMPRELSSNWVFRMLPLREPRVYAVARRRAMLAVSVAPVTLLSAIAFFWMWPWLPALAHVIVLVLLGLTIVEAVECGSRRIPFACSYLPGGSNLHIAVVVLFLVVIPLVIGAASLEREALQDGTLYIALLAFLGLAWAMARCRTIWLAPVSDGLPVFDAEPEDRAITLELWDNRITPALRRSSTEKQGA